MTSILKPTPARLVPGISAVRTELEHRRRYRFFAHLARNQVAADIACGYGYGTQLLAGQAHRAVGLDNHPETLAVAAHRYPASNLLYIRGDAQKLPFASGLLDRIFSFLTLEYLVSPTAFLAEVTRVLRSEGLFVLATPNRLTHSPGQVRPRDPLHVQEWTLPELRQLLERYFRGVFFLGQSRQLPCSIHFPPLESDHFLLAVCSPGVPPVVVRKEAGEPPPLQFWQDQWDFIRLVWRWLVWKISG